MVFCWVSGCGPETMAGCLNSMAGWGTGMLGREPEKNKWAQLLRRKREGYRMVRKVNLTVFIETTEQRQCNCLGFCIESPANAQRPEAMDQHQEAWLLVLLLLGCSQQLFPAALKLSGLTSKSLTCGLSVSTVNVSKHIGVLPRPKLHLPVMF